MSGWGLVRRPWGRYRALVPDRELTDALLEVVRERMEQEGLSGNRLAQLTGLKQPTVAKHLRGQGTPTVDDFDAIAGALQTDLAELLEAARRRL